MCECVCTCNHTQVTMCAYSVCVCLYLHVCHMRACAHVCVWHATCSMGHMCNIVATFCVHPLSLHLCTHYTSTHTHTHTYMPSSHLLSLPSVLFTPISPLCPTQGSRLADVMTTSCSSWSTQSTTGQFSFHVHMSLCFLLFPS